MSCVIREQTLQNIHSESSSSCERTVEHLRRAPACGHGGPGRQAQAVAYTSSTDPRIARAHTMRRQGMLSPHHRHRCKPPPPAHNGLPASRPPTAHSTHQHIKDQTLPHTIIGN